MLPVAFTCPLWWVARWATRVLTSLAVVAALALGAGPASAAAPTPGALPGLSAVPSQSAVLSQFGSGSLATSCQPTWRAAAEDAAHPVPAARAGVAEGVFPAWSVDAQPALPGAQGAIATGVLPVCETRSDRLPLVDGLHSSPPRGPPGR
ncbi:hypothetical protein AB0A95_03995 [Micromonospora sp. NPDC049230]|uniref:hypothetical protein n=1 Tax=Micromonospora sp. NPDC049230 TaxID=3155502 RepID=UPI0033CAA127